MVWVKRGAGRWVYVRQKKPSLKHPLRSYSKSAVHLVMQKSNAKCGTISLSCVLRVPKELIGKYVVVEMRQVHRKKGKLVLDVDEVA